MKTSVKLIAYTTTIEQVTESEEVETFIAYCARVSNPGNQHNTQTGPKLINYLMREGHWSPFEMAHAVLDITTTRDIARQILRHRSFSFQEFSQRYGHQSSFSEGRELRWQDDKNRQNSLSVHSMDVQGLELVDEWQKRQSEVLEMCKANYEWALSKNVAKEVARSVLPEGLTASRLYMAGSMRSWIHYLEQRLHPSTQLEHREVAKLALEALLPIFPTLKALNLAEDEAQ